LESGLWKRSSFCYWLLPTFRKIVHLVASALNSNWLPLMMVCNEPKKHGRSAWWTVRNT
jgi:hypothetical protein